MRIKLVISIALLLAFLGVSCRKSFSLDSNPSGVEGQVLIGPVSPGPQREDIPSEKSFQATITVLDDEGQKVDEFQTDAEGKFRVILPPGTYKFIPKEPSHNSRYPRASTQTVEVKSGEFTKIKIIYDTGLR